MSLQEYYTDGIEEISTGKAPSSDNQPNWKKARHRVKKLLFNSVLLLLLLGMVAVGLGYHGTRNFDSADVLPHAKMVISKARALKGTPYDPLMGGLNDIGARLGFIVCTDIIDISFGLSGYSWKQILRKDFEQHTDAYDSRDGNNPNSHYFHRRARNLYAYFKANDKLAPSEYVPSPGDLVFYRKSNMGMVGHVALVTDVMGTGYRIMESAPRTIFAQEVNQQSPLDRGWILAGFGRMY